MLTSAGHVALALSMGIALLGTILPTIGMTRNWHGLMQAGRPLALLQLILVTIAYASLTVAFVGSDFSLSLVVNNSHTAKPLIYRLTGVWGNHEGSMLLWILMLSLYGCLVAMTGERMAPVLRSMVLAVLSAISLAFIAFVLFTSNPFARIPNPPFDGNDLNPLLQDPGLAFHPPLLYLGYVGLAVPFGFAVAALLTGRADAAWARWVRPWALVSWLFLTLGITLGSWWAYYELGWGGWWFWDPVENVSFIPWLVATAMLHSVRVVECRGCLARWTILLAIAAFSLSLLGTFIVRSGIITSVHAFASDPTRGIFILGILIVFTGGSLALFATRSRSLGSIGTFSTVSRESALLMNNVLLATAAGVVLTGTFWPVLVEMLNDTKLSVGPPYFNTAFTPFAIVLLLLLPLGSTLGWKRGIPDRSLRIALVPAILAFLTAVAVLYSQGISHILGIMGLALAVWTVAGALADHADKIRLGRVPLSRSLAWSIRLPAADWGKMTAHAGLGLVVMGIAGITAWEVEDIRVAGPGDRYSVGGYHVEFKGSEIVRGPNYIADTGYLEFTSKGGTPFELRPEARYYPVADSRTIEAAIHTSLLRDVYAVIGDAHEDGGRTVRIYVKPFAIWIWFGGAVMALGGLISAFGNRFTRVPARIGSRTGIIPEAGS